MKSKTPIWTLLIISFTAFNPAGCEKEEIIEAVKKFEALPDVDIASGPSSGGFYVFHISTVDRGFEVMHKL